MLVSGSDYEHDGEEDWRLGLVGMCEGLVVCDKASTTTKHLQSLHIALTIWFKLLMNATLI